MLDPFGLINRLMPQEAESEGLTAIAHYNPRDRKEKRELN